MEYPQPHASFTASYDSLFAIVTVRFERRLDEQTRDEFAEHMLTHRWFRDAEARVLNFTAVGSIEPTQAEAFGVLLHGINPRPTFLVARACAEGVLQNSIATALMTTGSLALMAEDGGCAARLAEQAAIERLNMPDAVPGRCSPIDQSVASGD